MYSSLDSYYCASFYLLLIHNSCCRGSDMSRVPLCPKKVPKQRIGDGRCVCSPVSPAAAPSSPEQSNPGQSSPMLPSVVHWPFSMALPRMQPTSMIPNLMLPTPAPSTQVVPTAVASTSMAPPPMVPSPLTEQFIGSPPPVHSSSALSLPTTPPPPPAPICPVVWSVERYMSEMQYRYNAAYLASYSLAHYQHQMQQAAMKDEPSMFNEQSPSPQEEAMDLSFNHSPMTCRQAYEQESSPLRLKEKNDPQPSTSRCTTAGKHIISINNDYYRH